MLARPLSLRRYTDLPALLHMLQSQAITFLDPRDWDDSNDSYYLALYKERKHLQTLLALCFTTAKETYHHWKVFANGSAGVCVTFKGPTLIDALDGKGVRAEAVDYLTLKTAPTADLRLRQLPFLKRYPYQNEQEFRIIYESKVEELKHRSVPVDLSCISKITLSPWIAREVAKQVRNVIRSIAGCERLSVTRSTLIGNEEWKAIGDSIRR
jgi:hypothetical protein